MSIINKIISIIFVIFFTITPVFAANLKPITSYQDGMCELVAKDVKKVKGGSLVFLSYVDNSGARIVVDTFGGHWINAITIDDKLYYIDYHRQLIMYSKEDVIDTYFDMFVVHVEIYDFNINPPTFPIRYYYPD